MTQTEAVALVEKVLKNYRLYLRPAYLADQINRAFKERGIVIQDGKGPGLVKIVKAACATPHGQSMPDNHGAAVTIVALLVEGGRLAVTP